MVGRVVAIMMISSLDWLQAQSIWEMSDWTNSLVEPERSLGGL